MTKPLPPLLSWPEVQERLGLIFPPGTPNREHCVWEIAAKTVTVMLYLGAVQSRSEWMRPDQVTRMTDQQTAKSADSDRRAWAKDSLSSSKEEIPGRWYKVNTRESIRDDTIRNALVANGAVVERADLATTSPAPRYALQDGFAALFDDALKGKALDEKIAEWQAANLTAAARMRITLLKQGAAASSDRVTVTMPSGETRVMSAGPSSHLSKAVIEVFAPRFLTQPVLLFLSESGNKIVQRDDALAKRIGLNIQPDKHLPDIILADVGATPSPLLVFVEVVHSDGPINELRKAALAQLAADGGFPPQHVAYVTAYWDRSAAPFRKTVSELAWGSYAWFAADPDGLLELSDTRKTLSP